MNRIPTLRFPEFEGDWIDTRLEHCISALDAGVSVNSEGRPARQDEQGILKTSCVTLGSFDQNENKVVNDRLEVKRLKEPVSADTIIISRMNTPALVGANAFVSGDKENLYLPDRLWAAKIKQGNNPMWVSFLTSHPFTRAKISARATGTSGSMKNVTKSDIFSLPVNVPKENEQIKIAKFLGAVDEKIRLLEVRHEKLTLYKKAMMQKIFSQTIRFKQDDGGDFPEWEVKKLGQIFDRVTRKNTENNKNVLTISSQLGLINQIEYFNKSVSAKDVTGYYLVENGEFAYNKSYSKGYPMGAIKRLNRYDKGVVSTLYICFRTKNEISGRFYEQFFEGGGLIKELHKIAQEGARNHGLLNLSVVEFFKDVDIPWMHLEEQQKIADFLSAIDDKIEAVSAQITQMQSFKKGLLQQMFV